MTTQKSSLGIAALIAILLSFSLAPGAGEMAPNPGLPAPKILYSAKGPIHLGDNEVPGWSYLYGNSYDLELYLTRPLHSLSLKLQTCGLKINAPVYLNYRKVGVLPRQIISPTTLEKPDYWGPEITIPLPAANLCLGLNVITITTDLVPGPKFSGDLNDFQMKNLRLIARESLSSGCPAGE